MSNLTYCKVGVIGAVVLTITKHQRTPESVPIGRQRNRIIAVRTVFARQVPAVLGLLHDRRHVKFDP